MTEHPSEGRRAGIATLAKQQRETENYSLHDGLT